MLASTTANTETLADLKGFLTNYFENTNLSDNGNGSISISAMKTQGNTQARSMETDTGRICKSQSPMIPRYLQNLLPKETGL